MVIKPLTSFPTAHKLSPIFSFNSHSPPPISVSSNEEQHHRWALECFVAASEVGICCCCHPSALCMGRAEPCSREPARSWLRTSGRSSGVPNNEHPDENHLAEWLHVGPRVTRLVRLQHSVAKNEVFTSP